MAKQTASQTNDISNILENVKVGDRVRIWQEAGTEMPAYEALGYVHQIDDNFIKLGLDHPNCMFDHPGRTTPNLSSNSPNKPAMYQLKHFEYYKKQVSEDKETTNVRLRKLDNSVELNNVAVGDKVRIWKAAGKNNCAYEAVGYVHLITDTTIFLGTDIPTSMFDHEGRTSSFWNSTSPNKPKIYRLTHFDSCEKQVDENEERLNPKPLQ